MGTESERKIVFLGDEFAAALVESPPLPATWQEVAMAACAKHSGHLATEQRLHDAERDIANALAAYADTIGARFMRELLVLARRPPETPREMLLGTGGDYVLVLVESQRTELDLAEQGAPVHLRPHWPWG